MHAFAGQTDAFTNTNYGPLYATATHAQQLRLPLAVLVDMYAKQLLKEETEDVVEHVRSQTRSDVWSSLQRGQ